MSCERKKENVRRLQDVDKLKIAIKARSENQCEGAFLYRLYVRIGRANIRFPVIQQFANVAERYGLRHE